MSLFDKRCFSAVSGALLLLGFEFRLFPFFHWAFKEPQGKAREVIWIEYENRRKVETRNLESISLR